MSHTLDGLNGGNCETPEMRDAIRRTVAEVLCNPDDVMAEIADGNHGPSAMRHAIRFAVANAMCTGPERVLADLDGQLLTEA